jgi:hypothetical protein
MLPDFERADRIGEFWATQRAPPSPKETEIASLEERRVRRLHEVWLASWCYKPLVLKGEGEYFLGPLHQRGRRDVRARRLVLAALIACLPIAGVVGPAAAKTPARGCPAAFDGPLTFTELIAKYPPPPEIPIEDVLAALDRIDTNDDDMLCVLGLPGDEINAIDNVANVPD